MSFHFQLATDDDIAIYTSWFDDLELDRRLSRPTPEWASHIRKPGCALWTALDEASRPVAFFQTEQDEEAVWFACAIDPAWRGKGRMVEIQRAFLSGPMARVPRLMAEVETDNAPGVALLSDSGFAALPGTAEDDFVCFELRKN